MDQNNHGGDDNRNDPNQQTDDQGWDDDAAQTAPNDHTIDIDQDVNDIDIDSLDQNEMERIYEDTFRNLTEGQVVRGRILQITPDEVLVDVGYKSEGVIPIEEFRNSLRDTVLKPGDEIEVYLEKTEDSNGLVVLSKEKADKIKIWDDISRKYEAGEVIDGRVISKIKGGLTVDIGVRAFLPGSQIDLRPVRDPEGLIGKTLRMKIIKLNKRRGNIVLSRRVILEEERESQKRDTLNKLRKGTLVEGTVKNITEYGAFIDLGGIDGLLHITDMSWGRVNHPSEMFQIGDKVEVLVLKFDPKTERVSLGLKQKTPDPWETADGQFPVGSKVKGKVISLTDYGAFVELAEGIEGLVHVSEMSWTRRVRHPSKLVAIGDDIEAVVLDLDKENKRISLGMKQAEPNPWDRIEEKYPVGAKVSGRVRNLTNFGAFVELEEGIDGLIHISDMSWTRRINHPSEVLKKGDAVDAVVMEIDPSSERLSLSLKHATPNPWDDVSTKFRIGSDVAGKVVRITDFGVFVELEGGIEGLVHISELDKRRISKPEEVCQVGDELTMRVIKIDPDERRIGLSVRRYQEAAEKEMTDMYIDHHHEPVKSPRSTMGDMFDRASIMRRLEQQRTTDDDEEGTDSVNRDYDGDDDDDDEDEE